MVFRVIDSLPASDQTLPASGIPHPDSAPDPQSVSALVDAVRQTLQRLANPGKAYGMAIYMRGRFSFLGIQTPERRRATLALIRGFRGDPLAAAEELWELPEREYQYVACDLLRRKVRRLHPGQFAQLERLVTVNSWWDTVDSLAITIGDLVQRSPELASCMDKLIASENFWLRRVALLHQLNWKEGTDQERLFNYCQQCAHDDEFFVRKAIGWALRQYARTAPQAVASFLNAHREHFSPLSLREAGKHLQGLVDPR